ncbi:MAG: hypothetical protein GOMPHAMPRED_003484 [Gomphillus americanus]|uniref:Uncharacterized protein n=1 Tax=Gomphillus americanus TaxID=1940652 RepID=A0A8H3FG78_9LECA|nr:MAG: hypothetical protein GOMPHAMPRED_003484 [Gomphillus americanus]
MHYTTCTVILAAGSGIVSASHSMKDLFDIPSIARRTQIPAAKSLVTKPAGKNAMKPVVQNQAKSVAQKQKKPVAQQATPSFNQDDADAAQMRRAAKQAAVYMDAYQKIHPRKKGQSLADDMPPPLNFQFSNNYGTSVNNYNTNTNTYQGGVTMNNNQQYAGAGATIAASGSNVKVDKSMNDYRQQAAQGSTINGNNGGNRASKRSIDDVYEVKEDGRVVYRDFVLLVKAMKRDPAAKEEVLYEIAGVPGFRSLVENLIQQYTDTDGELTMNNFAALVNAMTQDKTVEADAIKTFNSNLVYAALIEKLLVKYYIPEDQGLSGSKKEKRDFDNEYFSFAIRSIDEDYLQMKARDFHEEYSWLASRGLDEEISQLLVRDLEAYMSYDPEVFY